MAHAETTFSVVIPVRDEAGNIGALIDEIRRVLEGHSWYEIVVVDDGSRDNTWGELQARVGHGGAKGAEKNSGKEQEGKREGGLLRLCRHREACGQSRALLTGIQAANQPWIVTLDGDGQNDPADIPKLWNQLTRPGPIDPLHVLMGHRVNRQDSISKKLASRLGNRIRARILQDATPDSGCGLKLFSRALFLQLPYFDHMHRFLPALFKRHGATFRSVPVNHRPRQQGQSHYGILDRLAAGLVDLLGVLWLLKRSHLPTLIEEESNLER
ncbi:MAG: glycosyltransferase family 2 protein [Magnetococcales bacterium]|nr:glycosyltransferase family 2 protein [Magnetococcales bacterium]